MTPWNGEQSIYEYKAMVYCMSSNMLKYNVLLIDAVFVMRNVYKSRHTLIDVASLQLNLY